MPPMRQIKRAKPIQQIKASVVYVVHHLSKYTNWRYAEMIHVYGNQSKGDQAKEAAMQAVEGWIKENPLIEGL